MIDKKTLQNLLTAICPEGFKLKKAHGGFVWDRNESQIIKRITIALNTHSNGFKLFRPFESIIYKNHEKTICKVSGELNLNKTEVIHQIHQLDVYTHPEVNYDVMRQPFHSIDESKPIILEVNKSIELVSMPFIEEYSNIQKLATLLYRTPLFDIPQYIHGDFPHQYAFLIMQEANIEGYIQKRDETLSWLNSLEKKNHDKDDYKQYRQLFEKLFF